MVVVVEGNLYSISQGAAGLRAITGKYLVIRFTHIEVEVDRIERDERRKEGGWARPATAAGDEVSYRDEMCANASRERRRNPAMVEIKLRVADGGLGGVDRCDCALPIRGPLIDVLGGAE